MQGAQIIVLATPVFLLLIAIEFAVGVVRGRNTYRLNDALSSIGLGILSQASGVFTKLMTVGIYTIVFEHVALARLPADAWWVWVAGLVFYDLCYYWHHRLGHRCAFFWAAHVVHHQSEDYNLSTALRQTSSGFLLGWVFYLPMAIAGVPPLVFGVVALVDLLYQYWVHSQQIGRLGWFDRWFDRPTWRSAGRGRRSTSRRCADSIRRSAALRASQHRCCSPDCSAARRCSSGTRTGCRWCSRRAWRWPSWPDSGASAHCVRGVARFSGPRE